MEESFAHAQLNTICDIQVLSATPKEPPGRAAAAPLGKLIDQSRSDEFDHELYKQGEDIHGAASSHCYPAS